MILDERDAGVPESSKAGTDKCPIMMDRTPASIAILNGKNSLCSSCSIEQSIVGKAECESVDVSP